MNNVTKLKVHIYNGTIRDYVQSMSLSLSLVGRL